VGVRVAVVVMAVVMSVVVALGIVGVGVVGMIVVVGMRVRRAHALASSTVW
jgi:preprotein translocase subunit Sss1